MVDSFKMLFLTSILSIQNYLLLIVKNILFFSFSDAKSYSNICIYRVANIGDTLCAIPAMYEIRKKYPCARITILTSPGQLGAIGASQILSEEPWINAIEEYYACDIDSWNKKVDFIKNLKQNKYDYLIQLPAESSTFFTQMRNLFFAKILNVKSADGFYISTTRLFPKTQYKYSKFPNEVERLVKKLPFPKNNSRINFPITVTQDDKNIVKAILKKYMISPEDHVMVISFSGKSTIQKWSAKNFNLVAKRWLNIGGKVIIIGSKKDYIEAEEILGDLPRDKSSNFCGLLSIKQSMYLLRKTSFLLTIDTGTAHMASAMNTPCITVFSSYYYPNKWVAYGNNNIVISQSLQCSPCLSREKRCRFGKMARCMDAITVDRVWNCINSYYLNYASSNER